MKYLSIIIDKKTKIQRTYNTGDRIMLEINIHFSKISKIKLRLKSQGFENPFNGGIQPLLLYGAPVWEEMVEMERYRKLLTGVQSLINIKIAKAYRTVSNEALCISTGLKPIHMKIKKRRNSTK